MQVAEDPLPFEDIFIPLAARARLRLAHYFGDDIYRLMSPAALGGWERYLLRRLTWVSAQAAYWQFAVYKTVAQAFTNNSARRAGQRDNLYRAFVNKPSERLRVLAEEFPGLGKMQESLIADWLSAAKEFLTRLTHDRKELLAGVGTGSSPVLVSAVYAGLSDPHRGGRTVAKVVFGENLGIYYKPRSIAAEVHFTTLIRLLNSSGIPHSLRAAKCCNRGAYGWMENIAHKPCSDMSGVQRFYWRAGALMCLVYLAKGVDIHRENMIADGEFPILVDLETLWHPQGLIDNLALSTTPSVMRTGFLPMSNEGAHAPYKWSALRRHGNETHSYWTWINVNTDEMEYVLTTRHSHDAKHLPIVDGVLFPASDFVDQVQAGFRWVGEWFLTSDGRRQFGEWTTHLTKFPLRQVKRSSADYFPLLEYLRTPSTLRSTASLEVFPNSIRFRDQTLDETCAVRRLDIPYTQQNADQASVDFPSFSKKDILRQQQIIAASLGADRIHNSNGLG